MSCRIYVACQMSGRDKAEMVSRAKYVCSILRQYGLDPISPVIAEGVANEKGPLTQTSEAQLQYFWKRDKEIITEQAHVVLVDEAFRKSHGVERELGLARYCLWIPLVIVAPGLGISIPRLEDDIVAEDVHEAGRLIRDKFGTWPKRVLWRLKLLNRTLPLFIYRQILAFR